MGAEDEKDMDEVCFVSSAVSEPRWASHVCDNKCREKSFKFFEIAAIVSEEERAAHSINLRKKCSKWKATEAQRRRGGGFKVVRWSSSRLLERSCGQLLDRNNSCTECENVSQPIKRGPDRSWKMRKFLRQKGTDGRRQHETPYTDELELLQDSTDWRFEGVPMR